MAEVVYVLGALTSLCCAVLLLRAYSSVKRKLLLWSGYCFVGLTISNAIVFIDLVLIPDVNLYRVRLVTAAIALLLLLYGLIWESD
jgi:hypothetical protein